MTDQRRYGVIEARRINDATYHLMIGGELWSEVEWSPSRQRWCIQDAAGHCLTHVEHIVGQDRDVQTAIRLAKRMIVDGAYRLPKRHSHSLNVRMTKSPAENFKKSCERRQKLRERYLSRQAPRAFKYGTRQCVDRRNVDAVRGSASSHDRRAVGLMATLLPGGWRGEHRANRDQACLESWFNGAHA